jgi:dTDP-4-amino-4,6-dideoxygalactose transaminase
MNINPIAGKRIYMSSPTMHTEEILFIKDAFDTNMIAPVGANIDNFEKEIASYVGISHAAALNSGTSSLHLALKLAGVSHGDVVLCSDLTFIATANAVIYEGAIPVFVDSERDTWNMDPGALEIALRKYPDTRAVITVNLYGIPAKLAEIKAICDCRQVPLIEDAAESLGAKYRGRQTGIWGDYGIYSFNGNKIITASGGGMLVSENARAIQKARFWATQSKDPAPFYQHSQTGYNYRMSNVLAGIGRGQLLHLREHIELKKKIYDTYKSALFGLPLSMNPFTHDCEPSYWLSCILIESGCAISPADIIKALSSEDIESRHIWKPMHMQPVFENNDFITAEAAPVSRDIFARGMCLPSDIKMSEQDLAKIISIIKKAGF